MTGNILVFVEQRDGAIHPASLRMFGAAESLAEGVSGEVEAAIVGHGVADLAPVAARHGARRVHLVDAPGFRRYRTLPYVRALAAAIEAADPSIILLAATAMSRDLAPRLAARLGAALASDCLEAGWDGGELRARRTMYCAKCIGELALASDRPRILTIRGNAYAAPTEQPGSGEPTISRVDVGLTDEDERAELLDVVRAGDGTKDVADSDIVVSGGRSLKSKENFEILYELAEALDGAVGASRAAVDAGLQPQSRQVGLTGKVVAAQLYIACGIDGAIQHLAGMRGSRVIVAVNTKPDAPIFGVATYGCVTDLFTFVPLLTEEIRRLR